MRQTLRQGLMICMLSRLIMAPSKALSTWRCTILQQKLQAFPFSAFFGGEAKPMETDLTIGLDTPENMGAKAADFIKRGVGIIKIKLGTTAAEDIERVKSIREAVGPSIKLRADANQGWSYEEARKALTGISEFDIEFCEQPMRYWDDEHLPLLRKISPVPIMADESVFTHHDARRLIKAGACDYINIKFAKSGGIHEAIKINEVCAENNIRCMMGGMLESRVALTAFAHFATAQENIIFYDMDTCMLGHKADPVIDGVNYNGFFIEIPAKPGIGADADDNFLKNCEKITV